MLRTLLKGVLLVSLLGASLQSYAQTCEYFLGYIADEVERPYAVNKVYRYTPERIEQILSLRDQGASLCSSGHPDEGILVLKEAVKIINFTRLR